MRRSDTVLELNAARQRVGRVIRTPAAPLDQLHQRLPGYAPTRLHDRPELARGWRLGRVLIKDETSRLGLPSFKVLGASWGAYQALLGRAGMPAETPLDAPTINCFRGLDVGLVTATDGNHGRAVAWVARQFGLSAQVFVPRDAVIGRVNAIEAEGAQVVVVDGDYDDACAAAAAALDERSCLVSDTSWPGHEQVPRWVCEGYNTMFVEVDAVVPAAEIAAVFVPVGVGTLAAAVVAHYPDAVVVAVEPDDADCVARSLATGSLVSAPGPHRTAMAGLNCGTPSAVAWPVLRAGVDAAVRVAEAEAVEAMRLLASMGIATGATGAAATAGAAKVLASMPARSQLGLDESACILLLVTEGVTDPDHYSRVVTNGAAAC